jgi:hypothetical protein
MANHPSDACVQPSTRKRTISRKHYVFLYVLAGEMLRKRTDPADGGLVIDALVDVRFLTSNRPRALL